MPNPILPIPQYPDVPFALGVPVVLRDAANSAPPQGQALSADAPGVYDTSTAPQWGLFDLSGNAVITADSVLGFEYKKTWKIPNYPQEQGAFATYNKVELPGEPRMVFTKAGSVADRTAFLAQVETVCASLDLYAAYTPEVQFGSVNPTSFNILNRTADQGATVLRVEILLEEVRLTAGQQFSSSTAPASPTNTVQPSGQAQQNIGAVLPQTPTANQSAAVTNSLAQQTLMVA